MPQAPRTTLAVFCAVAISFSLVSAQRGKPAPAAPSVPPPPAVDQPVPFHVGEVLTYDVSYSSTLSVATATLSVVERRASGNTPVYVLVGEVKPGWLSAKLYPISYRADALLDTRMLLPVQASLASDERGRKRLKTTTFHGAGPTIDYDVRTASVVHETRTVLPRSLDALSVLYVLRTLPLTAGTPVDLALTADGHAYRMHVVVAGPEPRKSVLGTNMAWRLTPTITDEHGQPATSHAMTLWLLNDARRLPLRLEAGLTMGSFVLTLATVGG